MNVRPNIALALVAALALGSVPARADEVLTLDQALALAKERNLDLRAAQQRIEQAKQISGKVWANFLPQIRLNGSYTYNQYEAKLGMPVSYVVRDFYLQTSSASPDNPTGTTSYMALPYMGDPNSQLEQAAAENPELQKQLEQLKPREVAIQQHHQLGGALSLDQTLLAPALFPALSAAGQALDAAKLGVAAAQREILFGTAQLYYGLVGLKESIALTEKQVERAKAIEADAKVKVDVGTHPRMVYLSAQVDRTRYEQDLLRARNAYLGMKQSLAMMLDRPADFDVTMPTEPKAPTGDLEELARHRPDVQAAKVSEELARTNITGGWVAYLPSLGFNATYQMSNVGGFTGQYGAYFLRLGLQWTLWDGGLREANLREYGAQLEEAVLKARSAELKAQTEVRQARLDLENALANRAKAEEQIKITTENRTLIDAAFRNGAATYLDVSNAGLLHQGAEMALLSESLNAQVAVLKLAKAAGAFDP